MLIFSLLTVKWQSFLVFSKNKFKDLNKTKGSCQFSMISKKHSPRMATPSNNFYATKNEYSTLSKCSVALVVAGICFAGCRLKFNYNWKTVGT